MEFFTKRENKSRVLAIRMSEEDYLKLTTISNAIGETKSYTANMILKEGIEEIEKNMSSKAVKIIKTMVTAQIMHEEETPLAFGGGELVHYIYFTLHNKNYIYSETSFSYRLVRVDKKGREKIICKTRKLEEMIDAIQNIDL